MVIEKMGSEPRWKPCRTTIKNIHSDDYRIRYSALRNSSDSFIRRKDVRKILYKKHGGKCYICGNANDLQIDHIISVQRYAMEKINPFMQLNSFDNLALICGICNASKRL